MYNCVINLELPNWMARRNEELGIKPIKVQAIAFI
jgi:hypothetical protein